MNKIHFSKAGGKLDFSAEVFKDVCGYAIKEDKTIFIPSVTSKRKGAFSKFLKVLEEERQNGFEIVFSSVFSSRLMGVLRAHGYKFDSRKFKEGLDDDNVLIPCFVKAGV